MNALRLGRRALWIGAALGMLAGCGGARTGAIPAATNALQGRALRATSGNGDLIYVSGPESVYILSYSTGKVLSSFAFRGTDAGLCSDNSGNVFIPAPGFIYKFAHGGTKPVATLEDTGNVPLGCSVDSTSGNLAVANEYSQGCNKYCPGNIAIYTEAKGKPAFLKPAFFADNGITRYFSCGYDGSGNLFLDGATQSEPFIFAELPQGSSKFTILNLNKSVQAPGAVQWDGEYVAVGAFGARRIYRVAVSGSSATVISTTSLHSVRTPNSTYWLQGNKVLTAAGDHQSKVGLWDYPRGGEQRGLYFVLKGPGQLDGLTVSVGK
jgi:hypothetical protein